MSRNASDRKVVGSYASIVCSDQNWAGTTVVEDGRAAHTVLAASSEDGLRIRRTGAGTAQFYLRSLGSAVDVRCPSRHRARWSSAGTVRTARTTIAVHCRYLGGADVHGMTALRALPVDHRSSVKIPVACFAE